MDDINGSSMEAAPAQTFVFSRAFDAPLQLVWSAWTESERLAAWWLPPGYTLFSCGMDLRPDGYFCFGMRSPQGQELWGEFDYRETVALKRLVFVASLADMLRNARRRLVGSIRPLKVLNDVTFADHEGTTQFTLRCFLIGVDEEELLSFEAAHEGLQESMSASCDRLATYLDDELEIAWAGAPVAWK